MKYSIKNLTPEILAKKVVAIKRLPLFLSDINKQKKQKAALGLTLQEVLDRYKITEDCQEVTWQLFLEGQDIVEIKFKNCVVGLKYAPVVV